MKTLLLVLIAALFAPAGSEYQGTWMGSFASPVPERLTFAFSIRSNGTYDAHVLSDGAEVRRYTATWVDAGMLVAVNDQGVLAFTAVVTGPRTMMASMANLMGPPIPGVLVRGAKR